MKKIALVLALVFSFGFSSHAFAQNTENRIQTIFKNLTEVAGDSESVTVSFKIKSKISDEAYFSYEQKKILWFKGAKRPVIHINSKWCHDLSDAGIRLILAHELGHYFDAGLSLGVGNLANQWKKEDEGQAFADAFAIFILGEESYIEGQNEIAMHQYLRDPQTKWRVENDESYRELLVGIVKKQTDWFLLKAKQKQEQVNYKIKLRRFLNKISNQMSNQ